MKELGTALKGVGGAVSDKIFRNMSERAVGNAEGRHGVYGPVRLRVVEEAQQEDRRFDPQLEESGDIVVSRSGEEDQLV